MYRLIIKIFENYYVSSIILYTITLNSPFDVQQKIWEYWGFYRFLKRRSDSNLNKSWSISQHFLQLHQRFAFAVCLSDKSVSQTRISLNALLQYIVLLNYRRTFLEGFCISVWLCMELWSRIDGNYYSNIFCRSVFFFRPYCMKLS